MERSETVGCPKHWNAVAHNYILAFSKKSKTVQGKQNRKTANDNGASMACFMSLTLASVRPWIGMRPWIRESDNLL